MNDICYIIKRENGDVCLSFSKDQILERMVDLVEENKSFKFYTEKIPKPESSYEYNDDD